MGILDSISKNPSFLALAALGIGLFIFRDRISGFFSDITGGAEGAASIAETGGLLARNLQSNLTQTPLPEDPLFGTSGFFTNIAKGISEFKFPSFEFPSISGFGNGRQEVEGTNGDFTDVGMAQARGRQTEGMNIEQEIMKFPTEGFVVADPVTIPFAVTNVEETQAEFQERGAAAALALPNIFENTSFGSVPSVNVEQQLSRESADFGDVLAQQARQSESIFAALFGNVQNPNF